MNNYKSRKLRTSTRGQALIEWVVYGSVGLLVWILAAKMSWTLYTKTRAQTTSVFAARIALSGQTMKLHDGIALPFKSDGKNGKAQTWIQWESSVQEIRIPKEEKIKVPKSPFNSSFSGYRFSSWSR